MAFIPTTIKPEAHHATVRPTFLECCSACPLATPEKKTLRCELLCATNLQVTSADYRALRNHQLSNKAIFESIPPRDQSPSIGTDSLEVK